MHKERKKRSRQPGKRASEPIGEYICSFHTSSDSQVVSPDAMSKEGFLISHEESERSEIYYCVLGEGKFQLYSKRFNGVLVREIVLSKSKLKIRGVPDEDARGCPFSFTVHLQRSKIKDGRQIVFGKPEVLILSAPSWGERKLWGNAIHAWQRNYWGEPQHQAANMDDEETEAFFLAQHKSLEGALQVSELSPEYPESKRANTYTRADVSSSTSSASGARSGTASSKKKAAAAVSRVFFTRAQAVKSMGTKMGKKIRAKSSAVTFSLPPMGVSFASSVQQQPAH